MHLIICVGLYLHLIKKVCTYLGYISYKFLLVVKCLRITPHNHMKDLNSFNKHICNSCGKEIEFIWYSSIFNNSSYARLCIVCRNEIIKDLYN